MNPVRAMQEADGFADSTPSNREIRSFDQLQRERARVFEADLQREAAAMAARIYESASTSGRSDHLGNLSSHSARFARNNALLIPGRDLAGLLWNLQRIEPDGSRRFVLRGRMAGLMTWLGELDPRQHIVPVAHDFRDAALLHRETGLAVACALTVGNSKLVASALRDRFPDRCVVTFDAGDATLPRRPK